jgi:Kef-type K+ transport system membrane component KefB
MTSAAQVLISLGGILLVGLATDAVGRKTHLPRVTLLLLFGILIGPASLDLLPQPLVDSFDLTANMALVMVGFLLGSQFTLDALREHGKEILWISIVVVLVTAAVVFSTLAALGIGLQLAIILAGISASTAPAATVDVVREAKAEGPFSRTLLRVVAIDDAWGLILFSICFAAVGATLGTTNLVSIVETAAWDIGGALVLGVLLGLPAAYLTGRIEPGEPTLIEAVGVVFICGGLAIWINVSYLIAAMVLGTVVVNLAQHHMRPFHAIENIEWPFMVLFFVLAGASLSFAELNSTGRIIGIYIAARVIGKALGGWIGGTTAKTDRLTRQWIGVALMPQAGVALGMALVASSRLPQFKETLLPVVVASSVFFELFGPVLTRFSLRQVGEAK